MRKILLSLVLLTSVSFAKPSFCTHQDYCRVEVGQEFEADQNYWCYDDELNAKVLAEGETERQKCNLTVQKVIEAGRLDTEYRIKDIKLSYETQIDIIQESATTLIQSKEEKIKKLNQEKWLWLGAGVAGGIIAGVIGVLVL